MISKKWLIRIAIAISGLTVGAVGMAIWLEINCFSNWFILPMGHTC